MTMGVDDEGNTGSNTKEIVGVIAEFLISFYKY